MKIALNQKLIGPTYEQALGHLHTRTIRAFCIREIYLW